MQYLAQLPDKCNRELLIPPLQLSLKRVPAYVLATDNLDHGAYRQPKERALRMRYSQQDGRKFSGGFRHDCDAKGAFYALDDINGPLPNYVVVSPDSYRLHATYVLRDPIHLYDGANDRVIRKAAAVQRGLGRVLAPLGNDPAFGCLLTKTPGCAPWITVPLHPYPYTLDELAENLPAGAMDREARTAETAGLGRNCAVFEELRALAYGTALRFKEDGRTLEQFTRRLGDIAAGLNLQFSKPMAPREVRSIAKSVGAWTWRRFTPEKFAAIQSYRGKLGAAERWRGHVPESVTQPWLAWNYSKSTWQRRGKPPAPSIAWRAAA